MIQDAELKDVFLDRIGIALNTDTEALDLNDRVDAVNKVLPFAERGMSGKRNDYCCTNTNINFEPFKHA